MALSVSSKFQSALDEEITAVRTLLDKLVEIKTMLDASVNSMSYSDMMIKKKQTMAAIETIGTKPIPSWKQVVREAFRNPNSGTDLSVKEIMIYIKTSGYDVSDKSRGVFYNSVYTVLKRSGEFEQVEDNKWRVKEAD